MTRDDFREATVRAIRAEWDSQDLAYSEQAVEMAADAMAPILVAEYERGLAIGKVMGEAMVRGIGAMLEELAVAVADAGRGGAG